MSLTADFQNNFINIGSPQTDVLVQDLVNFIREEEASERGIVYDAIAGASGKEDLGNGVAVGVTVNLLGDWQIKFWEGNYIAKIYGGNLVGGPGGDPIAYSAGVQTLLIQSAASTVVQVSSGSGLSTEEHNALMAVENATEVLTDANAVEPGIGVVQAMRLGVAADAGKTDGMAGTTVHIRNPADTKNRVTATVDSDGNRTAVTLDLA